MKKIFFFILLIGLNSIHSEIYIPPLGRIQDCSYQENFIFYKNDDYPLISHLTFRNHANHVFDEVGSPLDTNKIMMGDSIYVNMNYLNFFFEKVHPNITTNYVLITYMHDWTLPGSYEKYLNDDKIIAWFSTNADTKAHIKMHLLPIGIPYIQVRRGFTYPEIISDLFFQKKNT